jgi:hypothetical protein
LVLELISEVGNIFILRALTLTITLSLRTQH